MNSRQKKRVRLSREERYPLILAEARQVFIEMGYDAASMSEVARRANIVEGTIYRYFDNKRDLLLKVLEDWLHGALSDYDERLAGITGVRNRLRFMIWYHLSILAENPQLCNLLVLEVRSSSDYEKTACYRLNQGYIGRVDEIVLEGVRSGEFAVATPVRLVRDLIFGGCEYHLWRYISGRGCLPDIEAVADGITDLVCQSMASQYVDGKDVSQALARLDALVERLDGSLV